MAGKAAVLDAVRRGIAASVHQTTAPERLVESVQSTVAAAVVTRPPVRIRDLVSGYAEGTAAGVAAPSEFDTTLAKFPAERLARVGLNLSQIANARTWWQTLTVGQQAAQATAWEGSPDTVVAGSAASIPAQPIIGLDPSVLAALDARYEPIVGAGPLTVPALKTADYVTPGGEFIRFDAAAASRNLTMPINPPDGTTVGARMDAQDTARAHTVTLTAGGGDAFIRSGGSTTMILAVLDESVIARYRAAEHVWVIIEHGWSKSGITTRAVATGNQLVDAPGLGLYFPEAHGAVGDGTTDDTAAIQAALNACPAGGTVWLRPANYRTSAPLIIPPYVTLRGAYMMRGTNTQSACIMPLSSFSGVAIVSMVDQATGGYSGVSEGQRIHDLTLDGSSVPGSTSFSGIAATGVVHGVMITNVDISTVTNRGVQSISNAGLNPYSWWLQDVHVYAATVDGFRLSGMTDSTLIGCRAIGCGRRGWYIDNMANSQFFGCRSEFSGERGWYITSNWGTGNGAGGAVFVGCSTDRNTQAGVYIDATGSGSLVFTGLVCRRDGANGGAGGGGYSGLRVSGATMPVVVNAISVYPGVNDDGTGTNSPSNGVSVDHATWVQVASGYLHGDAAAFVDGGSNTMFAVSPAVGLATGTTAAPTRTAVGLAQTAGLISAVGADIAVPLGKTFRVGEGTNAYMGTAVLVAGQATVNTTAIAATSRVFLTTQTPGGTPGAVYVNSRTNGTSFVIKSTSATDTSTVAWLIHTPA